MLFWHLACRQNPHIRQVCCGFAAFDQLQNSYRYTFFCFLGVRSFGIYYVTKMLTYVLNEMKKLSSVAGGGGAL